MLAWLARAGEEICVLQSDRNMAGARRLQDHFQVAGDGIQTLWYNPARGIEKVLTLPLDRLIRRSPYRGNFGHRMWMIAAAVRHFKPDVVYSSQGLGYGAPAALLKRLGLLKPPLLVQSIGGDFMDEPAAEYGTRRTLASLWLFRQVLEQATLMKPVSPLLAKIMREMGCHPEKIRVIPSHLVAEQAALDRWYGQRQELAIEVRGRYAIPPDAPLAVTLSGNWPGKGTQVMAEAWQQIRERVPGIRWLLAGPHPTWYVEQVQPLVRQYPEEIIETRELHGEAVFKVLAAADLSVVPTLADGLNMVTVEAAAVGTPSLITDKAGIAAWVGQCAQDMVVPAQDAAALAQAVIGFFARPENERIRLGQQFHAMSTEFDVARLGERLRQLFREVVGAAR